jgi:predicted membrane protein
MKMGMTMIWGILFLFIGAALIAKVVFKIDIPIFKVILALFFIFIGIRILVGNFGGCTTRINTSNAIFSESEVYGDVSHNSEYNAVFGKVKVDLRKLELKEHETRVTVNAVFGGAEVWIPKDMPVRIKTDVAFGGTKLPEGNAGGFGTSRYESKNYSKDSTHLYLDLNAVFGGIDVIVD